MSLFGVVFEKSWIIQKKPGARTKPWVIPALIGKQSVTHPPLHGYCCCCFRNEEIQGMRERRESHMKKV